MKGASPTATAGKSVYVGLVAVVVTTLLWSVLPRPRLRPQFPVVVSQECSPTSKTRVPHILYIKTRNDTTHALTHEIKSLRGQGWRINEIDDDGAREFVAKHCPSSLWAYDCLVPGAYKADVFRTCAMNATGGVYIDDDLAPLVSLTDAYIEQCDKVQLYAEYEHDHVNWKTFTHMTHVRHLNGVIFSPPAAPIWDCVLRTVDNNVMTNFYGDDAVDVTGPGVLAHCAESWGVKIIGYLHQGTGFVAREPPHPVQFIEVNGHIKTKLHGRHYSELWSARLIYDCPDSE